VAPEVLAVELPDEALAAELPGVASAAEAVLPGEAFVVVALPGAASAAVVLPGVASVVAALLGAAPAGVVPFDAAAPQHVVGPAALTAAALSVSAVEQGWYFSGSAVPEWYSVVEQTHAAAELSSFVRELCVVAAIVDCSAPVQFESWHC